MASPGGKEPTPTRSGYEVKAATVRAHLAELEKLGLLAEVMERLPVETRRALAALPLPTSWVDGMVMQDIMSAIERARGIEVVRAVTMGAQRAGTTPLLMPIVGGLMRLFGATPNALLSRFGDLIKTQLRGLTFEWVLDAPTAGRLTIVFPRGDVPRASFVGFESGCRGVLDLCKVKGDIGATEISGKTGVIRIRWR